MRTPEAEIDVTPALVRSLLRDQHPDLADLPIEEVAHGWDNVLLRLGERLCVRMPRREAGARLIVNEQRRLPEIAARAHVRQVLPVIDEALRRAGVSLDQFGAIAVATRPGLVGSLVVGLTAAKALALVLDVPLRGSIAGVAAVCLLGAMSFVGIGLLVASRPRTIEGVSGLMNLAMFPMWIFSGVFFSNERFPDALQPFIQILPLTALNDALRAVMLEGASLAAQAPELGILAGWGIVGFAGALKLFRWS